MHKRAWIVVLVGVFLIMPAMAQTTATISGLVRDGSGAVIPGASVTAKNVETGITRNTLTDETGRYQLLNLGVGRYDIEASLSGFQTSVRSGIGLAVGDQTVVNFTLQVGQVAELAQLQPAVTVSKFAGEVAPIRVIKGPDTLLKNARSVAVDPVHNVLVVGTGNGILIFNRTDSGNVKPRGIIKGPKAGISTAPQNFRVIPSKGWIVAVRGGRGDDDDEGTDRNRGGGQAAGDNRGGRGRRRPPREIAVWSIAVWSINDNGDVPPAFALSSPNEVQGARVALNPTAKEVIIGGRLWVEVYSFPKFSRGGACPARCAVYDRRKFWFRKSMVRCQARSAAALL